MNPQSSTSEVLLASVELLEKQKIDYFLIGGIAVGVWGEPRYTLDADFVIKLSSRNTLRFLRAAKEHGFVVDEEVSLMNIDVSGATRLDFKDRYADVIVGESEFDQAAMRRRVLVPVYMKDIWVASAEDVILYKLVALRDRDLDDIRRIVTRQGEMLDRKYLQKWARTLAEALGNPKIPEKLGELLA